MSEDKKIIIDEDWKSQVEAERESLKQEEPEGSAPESVPEATSEAPSDQDPQMPPASIGMLMSSLATEALISMGQFPHPVTGETMQRRNQAKYLIDTLELLQEKTTGNLTSEESIALEDVLHQLRMAFVQSK